MVDSVSKTPSAGGFPERSREVKPFKSKELLEGIKDTKEAVEDFRFGKFSKAKFHATLGPIGRTAIDIAMKNMLKFDPD